MSIKATYSKRLDAVKKFLSDSAEYQAYLESEEREEYKAVADKVEPYLQSLYNEIAEKNPMEIIEFEEILTDEALEGIFVDKLMYFTILRASVDENYRFERSQERLEELILFAAQSSSFEAMQRSLLLPVRLAFSLSSGIWGNKVIGKIKNKSAREFFQRQFGEATRDDHARAVQYRSLKKRFKEIKYQSASVPTDNINWKTEFADFRNFLVDRIGAGHDNTTVKASLYEFLENDAFKGTDEQIELLCIFIHFIELDDEDFDKVETVLNELRKGEGFDESYFGILLKVMKMDMPIDLDRIGIINDLLDTDHKDSLLGFYELLTNFSVKDFMDEEIVESVEIFSGRHRELSPIMTCFKHLLIRIIDAEVVKHLNDDYTQLFQSMHIYDGLAEAFLEKSYRQDIKEILVEYMKSLMFYFEKGSTEYKAIKAMVMDAPVKNNFVTTKEVRALYRAQLKAEKAARPAAKESKE